MSRSGNDSAPGTADAPLRSLTRAIDVAPSGATIVLRAGEYHELVTIPSTKRLVIQNWPGEAVWLDGSVVVSGWVADGARWRMDGWTVEFDASPTYRWGAADNPAPGWRFVNPAYPMAAHPDQIWVDGVAQRQVGSLGEVVAGAFYHDRAADRLYLGSDPAGKTLRASALAQAIRVRSDGSVLRGFGIRRYAPSVPHIGAVTLERPYIVAENLVVTDAATIALHAGAPNITLRNLTIARSGMLGIHANYADNLRVERVISEHNNLEHFNTAPVSGGAKITRTRGVAVLDSIFRDNDGPGLWIDESAYDITIAGNEMRNNTRHGTSLEISARAVFANNIVTGNAGFGIKVNNTSAVVVWNNTFTGNGRSINVVQDGRRPTSASTPGRDPRQPFPDLTMTWRVGPVLVANNVLANQRPDANCLLCVEDYSQQYSAAQLGVTSNTNVFNRPNSTTPSWLVVWSQGAGDPAVFTTLDRFRSATGQDANSHQVDGPPVVDGSGRPTASLPDSGTAQPLPAALATLIGLPAGARNLGAWSR